MSDISIPPITYREAVEADFPVVMEYYTKLNNFFYSLDYHLPQPENVAQLWLDSFKRTLGKFSLLRVAEQNGRIIGFLLSRIKRVPAYMGGVLVGELSDMWIVEEARRLGVADQLVSNALDWLRAQGVHSVEIQVLQSNEASWRLFSRLGFVPEFREARLLWENYTPAPPRKPDHA